MRSHEEVIRELVGLVVRQEQRIDLLERQLLRVGQRQGSTGGEIGTDPDDVRFVEELRSLRASDEDALTEAVRLQFRELSPELADLLREKAVG